MENSCNLPIQLLAVCDADGQIRPLRFRLEDEEHQLQTVAIHQVISVREVQYVGIGALIFLCRARLGRRDRLFELRYTISTHRWVLMRFLD